MSFSITTNTASQMVNVYANKRSNSANKALGALSSGIKTSSIGNGATLAITNQLLSQVRGLGQAVQNSNETMGLLQIADSGLSGINDNMQRIQTLTLQASNDTLDVGDRKIIQKEIDGLLSASDNIAQRTSYNGIQLLNGTGGSAGNGNFVTQSGANTNETIGVSIADSSVASLIGSIDVTTQLGRENALTVLDNAQETISASRADLGAAQNSLLSNISNISVTQVNTAAAQSQMAELDFAQESANFSRENVLSQIGSFAQSQANGQTVNLSRLLG